MTPENPPFDTGDRVKIVQTPILAHRGVAGVVERCTRDASIGNPPDHWVCFLRLDNGNYAQYPPDALALAETAAE